MEKNNNQDLTDLMPDESELMSLVELQKFIAEELSHADGNASFDNSFRPITTGLGLESPEKKEKEPVVNHLHKPEPKRKRGLPLEEKIHVKEPSFFTEPARPERSTIQKPVPTYKVRQEKKGIPQRAEPLPTPSKRSNRLADIISGFGEEEPVKTEIKSRPHVQTKKRFVPIEEKPKKIFTRTIIPERKKTETPPVVKPKKEKLIYVRPNPIKKVAVDTITTPPPSMPRTSMVRRAMAGTMDQVFMIGVLAGALLITSNLLTLGGVGKSLLELSVPMMIRICALEFVTLWLCYLTISVGVLNMTFGMWVWSLRYGYPKKHGASLVLRKLMRIVCGFLFFAPIVPSILLVFTWKGKNLLDTMSGSHVFQAS